jgi:hypothetical protein
LSSWGDGRTVILGTEGFIELRKYLDIGRDAEGDQVYMANGKGEFHFSVKGKVGYPFFGQLIQDCLNRTQTAMPQAHAFRRRSFASCAKTTPCVWNDSMISRPARFAAGATTDGM